MEGLQFTALTPLPRNANQLFRLEGGWGTQPSLNWGVGGYSLKRGCRNPAAIEWQQTQHHLE